SRWPARRAGTAVSRWCWWISGGAWASPRRGAGSRAPDEQQADAGEDGSPGGCGEQRRERAVGLGDRVPGAGEGGAGAVAGLAHLIERPIQLFVGAVGEVMELLLGLRRGVQAVREGSDRLAEVAAGAGDVSLDLVRPCIVGRLAVADARGFSGGVGREAGRALLWCAAVGPRVHAEVIALFGSVSCGGHQIRSLISVASRRTVSSVRSGVAVSPSVVFFPSSAAMPAEAKTTAVTISAAAQAGRTSESTRISVASRAPHAEPGQHGSGAEQSGGGSALLRLLGVFGAGEIQLVAHQSGGLRREPIHENC